MNIKNIKKRILIIATIISLGWWLVMFPIINALSWVTEISPLLRESPVVYYCTKFSIIEFYDTEELKAQIWEEVRKEMGLKDEDLKDHYIYGLTKKTVYHMQLRNGCCFRITVYRSPEIEWGDGAVVWRAHYCLIYG